MLAIKSTVTVGFLLRLLILDAFKKTLTKLKGSVTTKIRFIWKLLKINQRLQFIIILTYVVTTNTRVKSLSTFTLSNVQECTCILQVWTWLINNTTLTVYFNILICLEKWKNTIAEQQIYKAHLTEMIIRFTTIQIQNPQKNPNCLKDGWIGR